LRMPFKFGQARLPENIHRVQRLSHELRQLHGRELAQ
jgi:hypothetical protein